MQVAKWSHSTLKLGIKQNEINFNRTQLEFCLSVEQDLDITSPESKFMPAVLSRKSKCFPSLCQNLQMSAREGGSMTLFPPGIEGQDLTST